MRPNNQTIASILHDKSHLLRQHLISRYNTSFAKKTWRRGFCKCVVQFIHSVFIERGFLHLYDYKAPLFSSWSQAGSYKLSQHTFILKVESSLS